MFIIVIVVVGTGRPVRGGKAQEKGEQSLIIIDYVLVFVVRSLDTSTFSVYNCYCCCRHWQTSSRWESSRER